MKSLKILLTVSALVFSNLCFADGEAPSLDVTPIKEVKNESIDFKNLPSESIVGSLKEFVEEEETLLDCLTERVSRKLKLYPYTEGLAYFNGFLCHVGNYPRSIVYTVLEGPQYGLQTVTDYFGAVIYVNYDYNVEYTPYGIILYHYYDDSKIITGSTQVIKFY